MSCPRCGDDCRCAGESRLPLISPDFEFPFPHPARPQGTPAVQTAIVLDPGPYETSEEQCAASLDEEHPSPPQPSGMQSRDGVSAPSWAEPSSIALVPEEWPSNSDVFSAELVSTASAVQNPNSEQQPAGPLSSGSPDWKQEVAARLHNYRARRKPQGPRYPSLRLKFESADDCASPNCQGDVALRHDQTGYLSTRVAGSPEAAISQTQSGLSSCPVSPAYPRQEEKPLPEPARIIEFPRSHAPPSFRPDEIAEPVLERPRIVEAPEIVPPPPALGGITLETEEKETKKRPGFEIPLQTAPILRRVLAHALDGLVVISACALFAYIYLAITRFTPPVLQIAGPAAAMAAAFWMAYHYLLVVYTGSTLGLRATGLRLRRFDGSQVSRSLRRWRVLASILSVVPFGLGIAWCYFDEDMLCWHDRITCTYLALEK
jgi:uncharacterized RDD family membrane protein YckC